MRYMKEFPLDGVFADDRYAPGIGNVLTKDLNTGEEIKLVEIKESN